MMGASGITPPLGALFLELAETGPEVERSCINRVVLMDERKALALFGVVAVPTADRPDRDDEDLSPGDG